jgi:hypothetical protein
MAQRAGELNTMMERYQLDAARNPQLAARAAMADALRPAAQAAERRSLARPWSPRKSARPAAAFALNTVPAVAPMSGFTKTTDDDTDWKEF